MREALQILPAFQERATAAQEQVVHQFTKHLGLLTALQPILLRNISRKPKIEGLQSHDEREACQSESGRYSQH